MVYYDRRAADPLLRALRPGGFAASLVELARSGQYALDLQFRGHPQPGRSWATLYVGTTKVLDLTHHAKSGKFRLDAHATWAAKHHGWDGGWRKPGTDQQWRQRWPAVENYLENSILAVPSRYFREGTVQAGISRFAAPDLVVIDREAVVGFSSNAEKARVGKALLGPLMDAMADSGPAWWKPKVPGGECDAVAITRAGEVLAIEVKPAGVDIAWAPLQARHYADRLQAWADQTDNAADILLDLYRQRALLGLASCDWQPAIKSPVCVRPLVAVRRGAKPVHIQRMVTVVERLRSHGLDNPIMEFRTVNLVGRLDTWDLGTIP